MERYLKMVTTSYICMYMYIYIYISKISIMFAITKWSQDQCTRDNVSERERKEKIQKSSLHPSYINTPPIKNVLY